jgi:nucleoside-diphosphate-sugar epimerase
MTHNAPPLYLVTGASGFVGGHMIDYLLNKGCAVRALVRSAEKAAALSARGVDIVLGDMKDKESLARAVQGVTGIFHIGAVFREAKLPDSEFFAVNVEGTRHLFEAAIKAGVPRLIYCSTNGVHGDVKNPPADETTPYAPCDVYQESKVASEAVAFEFYRSQKISGVILRPAMIYGPRDTRLGKIFRMIQRGRFFYVGKGEALCHFIDVRDLVHAFWLAMEHTEVNAEAFLIAGQEIVPLNQFCNLVADILHVKRPWLHIPLIPMQLLGDLCELLCRPFGIEPPLYRRRVDFYIKNRSFVTKKAQEMLGFQAKLPLAAEVQDIITCYQDEGFLSSYRRDNL